MGSISSAEEVSRYTGLPTHVRVYAVRVRTRASPNRLRGPPPACLVLSSAGHGVPLQADIAVGSMMKKDQERFPERREELLNLLGVDPNWRMHQVR